MSSICYPLFTLDDTYEMAQTHARAKKSVNDRRMRDVLSVSIPYLIHHANETGLKERFKHLIAREADPSKLEIELYRYRRTVLRRPANELYNENFPWLSTVSDVATSSLQDTTLAHLLESSPFSRIATVEQLSTPLWRIFTDHSDALPLLSLCMGNNMKVISRIHPEVITSFDGKIEVHDVSLILKYFPRGMKAEEKALLEDVKKRWSSNQIPVEVAYTTSGWGGEEYYGMNVV